MAKQKTVVPFHGTQEQEKQLLKIIADHKDVPGALMPVLQQAQELYGYLPIEVQTKIAEGLGISMEEVYEVVTFYAQFSLNPTGKHRVAVCLGTACYVKGAQNILEELEKQLIRTRAQEEDALGIRNFVLTPDAARKDLVKRNIYTADTVAGIPEDYGKEQLTPTKQPVGQIGGNTRAEDAKRTETGKQNPTVGDRLRKMLGVRDAA